MTCIVSVLIVLLCSIHPLLLVGRMIYILALSVVLWNFIITVKQFRFTLQLRSIQRLAQQLDSTMESDFHIHTVLRYSTETVITNMYYTFR